MFENFSFLEILVLFLVGGLFFKEQLWALLQSRFGAANTSKEQASKSMNANGAPPWAQDLVKYFNHDTTAAHKQTHEALQALIEMERKEHETNDTFRDTLKDINRALENIERYGVDCRK